jgi:hypothetical protein
LNEEPLGDDEDIVRGVYENEYSDDGKTRLARRVFGEKETSVQRLKYSWDYVWYFLRKAQKPPSRILHRGLRISVGKLREIGRNFTVSGPGGTRVKDERTITVIPNPVDVGGERNDAHAYIKETLPKTMAIDQIPPQCEWHDPP